MSARDSLILALPFPRPRHLSLRPLCWSIRALVGALAVVCLLYASGLVAKQKAPPTKTVSGLVMDKTEKGIGGAEVALKDVQTGKTTAIYTGEDGQYRFSDLDPHHDYVIQAKFKGVGSESRQISSFDTRSKLVINLTIPPPGS